MMQQKDDLSFCKLKSKVSTEIEQGDRIISHSQMTLYHSCPRKWYNTYVLKHKQDPSIHLVYGTAMHEVIQTWLKQVYLKSVKSSEQLDLSTLLHERLKHNYIQSYTTAGKHFSSPAQLSEYHTNGSSALTWLRNKRTRYYTTKNMELVGVEVPIYYPIDPSNPSVKFMGFIDLLFKDRRTGTYTIVDIKTSTRGWNKYQKQDKVKLAQMLLYKLFLHKQYGIQLDDIKGEYHIIRTIVDDGNMYPPPRVQVFAPPQKGPSIKHAVNLLTEMVAKCEPIADVNHYPAIAGQKGFNCNFCAFKDNEQLCPAQGRQYK